MPPTIIATHDGVFHADDVLAVATLRLLYPTAIVRRTRVPADLETADIRVDVGGEYAPEESTFDHHFSGSPRRPDGAQYASAGQVWKHFGQRVLAAAHPGVPEVDLALAHERIDRLVVEPVDRVDTAEIEGKVSPDCLAALIDNYNSTWVEIAEGADSAIDDARFAELVDILSEAMRQVVEVAVWENAEILIVERLRHLKEILRPRQAVALQAKKEAWSVVREAIDQTPRGTTVMLSHGAIPWAGLVHQVEGSRRILHVCYPGRDGNTYVISVPTEPDGMISRAPFPAHWAGLREEALERASGIEGAVFCHQNLFMSGWKSEESALKAAKIAGENAMVTVGSPGNTTRR